MNDSGYNNNNYDRFLLQSANAFDSNERLNIMYSAERMLLKDQPIMPIYSYVI